MDHATIECARRRRVDPPGEPSPRVVECAAMFGVPIEDDDDAHGVVPRTDVPLPRGGVVFVTGPSGAGKTTILGLIADACADCAQRVVRFEERPPPPPRPLIDLFEDRPLAQTASLLAAVGLADARDLLRLPEQLSDGQRFRLRLAMLRHAVEQRPNDAPTIVLADEFAAMLDRITAAIVARQTRRWIARTAHTLVCATSHDDLLEPLEPDVLVFVDLDGNLEVVRR